MALASRRLPKGAVKRAVSGAPSSIKGTLRQFARVPGVAGFGWHRKTRPVRNTRNGRAQSEALGNMPKSPTSDSLATAKLLSHLGELVEEIIRQRQQEIKDNAPPLPEPKTCPSCGALVIEPASPKRKRKVTKP